MFSKDFQETCIEYYLEHNHATLREINFQLEIWNSFDPAWFGKHKNISLIVHNKAMCNKADFSAEETGTKENNGNDKET